jgi:hypothetical protein
LAVKTTKEDAAMSDDMSDERQSNERGQVNTGGGAYIGGANTGGGDFVGRDKTVHGDEVRGDKVGGDKIGVGDISGSQGIAIGRGARAQVATGMAGNEIAELFDAIYQRIDARPEDPDVDKEEIKKTVQDVQQEAAKGEQANPNKVMRWVRSLSEMAPDIFEIVVAGLASPVAGVGVAVRKIAEKAKEERTAEEAG